MTFELDPQLLEVLVCPEDKGELLYIPGECLYNPRLRKVYRIEDGIPVMLSGEATYASDEDHQRLIGKAAEIELQQPGEV